MPATLPPRSSRGHAASGARMFVGGVAFSATLGLAGFMAANQPGTKAVATAGIPTTPVATNGTPIPSTSAAAALRRKTATTVRPKPGAVAAGTAPRGSSPAATSSAGSSSTPAAPQLSTAPPSATAPATAPPTAATVAPTVAPTAAPTTAPPPPPTTVAPTTLPTVPPTTVSHAS